MNELQENLIYFQVISIVLLVACTQAVHYDHQEAVSTVAFNDHNNIVHHIHSAPVVPKTVAVPVHAAPTYEAPSYHAAPFFQSLSSGHRYAAPIASSFHLAPAVATSVHEAKIGPAGHGSSFPSLSLGLSAYRSGLASPSLHAASAVHAAPIVHAPAIHATPAIYSAPAIHAAPAIHVAPAVHAGAAPSHHVEEYVSKELTDNHANFVMYHIQITLSLFSLNIFEMSMIMCLRLHNFLSSNSIL